MRYYIDMEHICLDNKFFLSCDLQHNLPDANPTAPQADLDAWAARQKKVAANYDLLRNKAEELFGARESTCNERLYDKAMDLFKRAETMREIQSLWSQEGDYASDNSWFLSHANDYIHALYTMPTDQLALLVPTLGFRGKYLTYYKGECYASELELRGELDYQYPDRSGDALFIEDMVVPFDAHSIWDALLLLLSEQWMWKPEMWFIADVDGKKLYPRVTIYNQQALATFCMVSAERDEDSFLFPIYKTGVLLRRKDDTFSIEGAYRVRIGETEDPCLPKPPKQVPPFHLFSEEEKRLIEIGKQRIADDLPF